MSHIDRFGVQAVMGRSTLGAGEIRRMIMAENIVRAYRAKDKAESWAEWAKLHPSLDALLNDTEKLVYQNGD